MGVHTLGTYLEKESDVKAQYAAVIVGCAVALGACSTAAEKRAKERESVSELQEKIQERSERRENKRKQAFINEVPEWAMEAPPADSSGVYAVGAGDSDKLTTAVRIADLQAQYGLASQLDAEISGSERLFEEDRGAGKPLSRYRQLIDKLVAEVPVVGLEVVEKEVIPLQGRYHAFVLLKMPYEAFNNVLQAKRAEAAGSSMDEAFDDLERRIEKRRAASAAQAPSSPVVGQAKVLIQEGPRDEEEIKSLVVQ